MCFVYYRYNVENIYTERFYLLNVVAYFCYETSGTVCKLEDTFVIFENTKLPKSVCNWDQGFKKPGKYV